MFTRRIVKSGNTSYTLALPISWVRQNNLEESKTVTVDETSQGTLIISAQKQPQITEKKNIVTIKVDGKTEEAIYLEVLDAYIRDASSIVFEGEEVQSKAKFLLKDINYFIGLDILEQSTNSIVVKNFWSMDKDTSPFFIIRKMRLMNEASMELLSIIFKESFGNEDFLKVHAIYEQTGRLLTLARKSILCLFEQPDLMKQSKYDYLQLSKAKVTLLCLHQISYSLLRMAQVFMFAAPSAKELSTLKPLFETVIGDYNHVSNAITNKRRDTIVEFLQIYWQKYDHATKIINSQKDPLLVQSLMLLRDIYIQLRRMSFEALE